MKSFINLLILFSTIFLNVNLSHASQHDYVISNDTGANVRADINLALLAGQGLNSGTTAPATMYAYQLWMDTSGGTPILKQRNAANSAWIIIGDGSLVGWGLLDRTGGTVSGELLLTATNDVKIPVGTTAQRNGSPVNGQIRYNSDLKNYEGYHESQFSQFQREVASADYISNVSLSASVGSNALTISLKTAAGSNAAAGDPAIIAFRSATLGSGDISLVKVTGSLSTVISSGSTAGHKSALEMPIWVYALNNAGTVELAWSTSLFEEGKLVTTTAEGGAGAADASGTMYSTTARTSVSFRLIGKLLSTQTTAGTWVAVPTNIQVGGAGKLENTQPVLFKSLSGSLTQHTANGSFQKVTGWTAASFDNYGAFASDTYTVKVAGYYQVNANVTFTASAAGGRLIAIYKNGSQEAIGSIAIGNATEAGFVTVSSVVSCAVGDTLDIYAYQSSGGNLTFIGVSSYNTWSLHLIK